MRLSLLACLILAAGPYAGSAAFARAHPSHHHHRSTRCPELRVDGFCPYDTGWSPAADNPLFLPLRRGDPEGHGGPVCWATDSRDRTLLSYETENPDLAMRIGGRLVHFRRAGSASEDGVERFVAREGRLTLREGATVAEAHEFLASRATLTFVDRGGRRHVASVRLSCAV